MEKWKKSMPQNGRELHGSVITPKHVCTESHNPKALYRSDNLSFVFFLDEDVGTGRICELTNVMELIKFQVKTRPHISWCLLLFRRNLSAPGSAFP